MVALREVAEINPRTKAIPADQEVSFVGMAQLDATAAKTEPGKTRKFSDVSRGYTVFRDGDLLVAKITPCFENGKIGQARLRHKIGVGSTEFHIVRPGECLHDRYLLNFLRQDWVRAQGELRMTGSAGQRRVPASYLAGLRIPVPSLPEQRRIAAILDQAAVLRAKRCQAISHLDDLNQSIFLDMFDCSRFPMAALSEVVQPGTIVTYGIVQAGPEYDDGVPYVRTGDIEDGEIQVPRLRHTDPVIAARFERSRVSAGDIVMSIRATVGTTAIVPSTLDGANLTQGTARISPSDIATGPYLLHYLRSIAAQRWIQAQVKGATFREITLGRLRQLPVPLAPLGMQEQFAGRLVTVQSSFRAAHDAASRADALFASLQSRAFRGEL